VRTELFWQFLELFSHPTFWVTGTAWLSACFLKVVILKIRSGAFHWERFFGTGGMPSSHTAFASGLTVGIGASEGFTSAVFGLSLGVTILTAVDATGLRRSAGLQAERVNQIVAELYKFRKTRPPKLKETLGHTFPEVLAGALLGALIAFLLYPVKP
jgi:acid phosphatase family membrane protein YuiD